MKRNRPGNGVLPTSPDWKPDEYQKARTASRSISTRSFGCKLERVVRSTVTPSSVVNRFWTPARSISENLRFGSISMKTSRSLSGRASPRAVEPKYTQSPRPARATRSHDGRFRQGQGVVSLIHNTRIPPISEAPCRCLMPHHAIPPTNPSILLAWISAMRTAPRQVRLEHRSWPSIWSR